jgi:hypothetical protein
MSSRNPTEPSRRRYVNGAEKAAMEAARQGYFDVDEQTFKTPEAMPRPRKSPFLAYHAHCGRLACALRARDRAMRDARAAALLAAALGARSAPRGA